MTAEMSAEMFEELTTRRACVLGCRTLSGEPFPAQHGYLTCDPCAERLRTALAEIVECYALLDDALVPGHGGAGGRGAPGFGSRSPARDGVLALTDPRTQAVEEGDPHSVLGVLSSWADNVRDDTGQDRPAGQITVTGEVGFLVRWLDFITRQYWVEDFADEVHELLGQLRTALGLQERSIPIGTCPTLLPDLDSTDEAGGELECGALLRVRLSAEWITCRSCGTNWPRERWDELRDDLGVPVSDVASLSAWLAVPVGTLRRWRHEDEWSNHGTRARPLYDRAQVVTSWRRRRPTG